MIVKSNIHTHTKYCDGRYTIEEMIQRAIELGFDTLGISPHSYISFDKGPFLVKPQEFVEEMDKLKEKYNGKIDILTGIELDYFGENNIKTDYVIGSVHFIEVGEGYFCCEDTAKNVLEGFEKLYKGNAKKFYEDYYTTVIKMVKKFKPDVIGHYDILTKFNDSTKIIDVENADYKKVALDTVDRILEIKNDIVFEVNTHGMYRGYKSEPYPAKFILEYLAKIGGRVMLSSDSHDIISLGYKYEELCKYLKTLGFDFIYELKKDGFKKLKI